VFDGEKTDAYVESDSPNPINIYGRSKLEGERYVSDLIDRFWIVRTSWLFGRHGRNFVKTILDMARRGESLRVVNDQVSSPTYTVDLVTALAQVLEKGGPGIYHVTNQGHCSWYEFAQEILRQAGLEDVALTPIPTSASGRPAPRPRNSCLANARLEEEGLALLPPWQDALHRYLLPTRHE
jgi:dTDP-4-dehydrorhamnose reductase